MKNLARFLPAAALCGAVLFLFGCATPQTARRPEPVRKVYHFTVVETAPNVKLTDTQVEDMKRSVLDFLRSQGLERDGDYYVRVDLSPEGTAAASQWVVLRVSTQATHTYTLLAAYPGPDDYYPYDNFGYYRYGYSSFSRYGYYDPFDYYYGYGSTPPVSNPPTNYKPGDRDRNNHPRGTPANWNPRTNDNDSDRRNHSRPPTDGNSGWTRGSNPDGGGSRNWSGGSGSSSSTPSPSSTSTSSSSSGSGSYSPPPSYSPPAQSEPAQTTRSDITTRPVNER